MTDQKVTSRSYGVSEEGKRHTNTRTVKPLLLIRKVSASKKHSLHSIYYYPLRFYKNPVDKQSQIPKINFRFPNSGTVDQRSLSGLSERNVNIDPATVVPRMAFLTYEAMKP